MSLNVDGDTLTSLVRQWKGSTLKTDERTGALTATVQFKCLWSKVLVLQPVRNVTKHPDFPNLVATDVSAVQSSPGEATITANYIGNPEDTQGGGGGDGIYEPVHEGESAISEDPIQSHVDFDTFGVAANGAIFDSDELFTGFIKPPDGGDDFRGLEAYLNAKDTHSTTYLAREGPTANSGVGKWFASVSGAPPLEGDENWLKVRRRYRKVGGFYEISEAWMGSGAGKPWNPTVYPAG